MTVGPDFFYNQYQYGATTIPGTGGVSTPLTANARMKPFNVFAGIEPAWYFNDERERRNWMTQDGLPGFGHEFAYFAGLGVAVGSWNIGGTIRHSMTPTAKKTRLASAPTSGLSGWRWIEGDAVGEPLLHRSIPSGYPATPRG